MLEDEGQTHAALDSGAPFLRDRFKINMKKPSGCLALEIRATLMGFAEPYDHQYLLKTRGEGMKTVLRVGEKRGDSALRNQSRTPA